MERTEQRELPGNDASWYREMIADRVESKRGVAAIEPELQEAEPDWASTADSPVTLETPTETEPSEAAVDTVAVEDAAEVPEDVADDEPDTHDATPKADEAAPKADEALDDSRVALLVPADAAVDDPAPRIAPVPPIEDDTPLENTSEMVGQMWTARETSGPLDDWEPGAIDRKVTSKRSFRWTTLIGVLAVIGLITAGLVVLPSVAQSRADSYLESITDALHELRAELPDTQNSLAVATDPASSINELANLTTQLTTLAAKASELDAATQADPPAAPPLTSSAPIDEVEPVRQQAEPLGTVAITIQRRIANLVEYRTLMSGFLVGPELPTAADNDTQAELRVELAAAQAESASVLAELPSDVSLEGHAALAREINERFATWQVDYLEALRTNDAVAAGELIAELESALTELDNALVTPLAQIRRQTDADLIDLARNIDAVSALAAEIG